MTRLLRLYPAAWRQRYEAEMLDLLAQRPRTGRDLVDLVRGAVDAHLHPQVAGATMPWTHRIPGGLTIATGALLGIAAICATVPGWSTVSGTFAGLAVLTMLIALAGDYLMAVRRATAIGIAVLALAFMVVNLAPWGIAFLTYMAGIFWFLGGGLTLAAIRAGIRARWRWTLVLSTVVVPGAFVVAGLVFGPLQDDPPGWAGLLAVPYGLAWVAIGIRMTVRGSPTIVDPPDSFVPLTTRHPETPA
jgi:hypothetical protein